MNRNRYELGKSYSPSSNVTNVKYKKVIKLKKLNIALFFLTIIGLGLLIYSSYNVFAWIRDTRINKKLLEKIDKQVTVQEVVDDEVVQVVEQDEEIDEGNPYWDYIKMSLIDVDFSELEATNDSTVGWIQVNGTNINYPFVQADDNEFYLTHTFNKSYNGNGWVFLDYRNNPLGGNRNTIIYAHGLKNKTMFGSLRNLLKSDWLSDTNNYVIKLSTKSQNTLWQIFSAYHIPTTSDYLKVNFSGDEDFKAFVDMLKGRSMYDFNATVSGTDQILTLSTCYSDDEKMVMHAKLIKYSDRTTN